ncbi:diphthamide biosynthesis protein 2 [Fimicolochytrium jonesii]|uniref:diphthamide biosynthesis protein 2 n=1 Tax=Fimicolochytrium jonesii TaxID=1396493 RepID=UPI0022FDDC68|nr:diphthamide biosynthesis protein 2 [Fimicolochytrium jonesii]KAI8816424.1 diphthamide biosynthesis protein 2 [Fimicolochytrium jonesii]
MTTSSLEGPTNFSNDGRDVLERTLDLPGASAAVAALLSIPSTDDASFANNYDIDRTAEYIVKNNYQKIALQFPDELLADSSRVASQLESVTGRTFYVLADTTFGSCCVDEIAAEHVYSDLVVHYGRTCLSPTSRIPVFYVFPKGTIDVSNCVSRFEEQFGADKAQPVLLVADVMYQHSLDDISERCQRAGFQFVTQATIAEDVQRESAALEGDIPPATVEETCAADSTSCCTSTDACSSPAVGTGSCCGTSASCQAPQRRPLPTPARLSKIHEISGRQIHLKEGTKIEDYSIFYVGPESLTLTNLVLTHQSNKIISYDPATNSSCDEASQSRRLLMRRYFMVQKAKDAEVIGIVVGTLGVAHYLSVIGHIKRLIIAAGKKPYILAVGKPNIAKLANFLEIDCFVLVACPENSLLDSREFLRPIVTPYELELALVSSREWTGAYETNLSVIAPRLLEGANELSGTSGEAADGNEAGEDSDDEPYFSLVTGTYKQKGRAGAGARADEGDSGLGNSLGQLTLRNGDSTLATLSSNSAGANYLNEKRTFRGLEPEIGNTKVSKAVEGRSGIARGYSHEAGKQEQLKE